MGRPSGAIKPSVRELADQVCALEKEDLVALAGLLAGTVAAERAEALTNAELRVRAETVAGRARPAGAYGRVVCDFCGAPKKPHALADHIRRQHPDRLAETPGPRVGPRTAG